jgi:negative regulator of sigma-B (phosphoserine phosphatase)
LADRHGPVIEWGSADRALGELGEGVENGDRCVVALFPAGALVAAIDGLGHGTEAATAANRAAQLLEAHPHESVLALIERCHEVLRRTRGAVISLASYDARQSSITWAGVGNVEAALMRVNRTEGRSHESLLARGGVVGYQLPPLRSFTIGLSRGDTLIMATDGIRGGFLADLDLTRGPQENADSILGRYGKGTDDALVVVARYLGDHS